MYQARHLGVCRAVAPYIATEPHTKRVRDEDSYHAPMGPGGTGTPLPRRCPVHKNSRAHPAPELSDILSRVYRASACELRSNQA